jgi:hypothetical protein
MVRASKSCELVIDRRGGNITGFKINLIKFLKTKSSKFVVTWTFHKSCTFCEYKPKFDFVTFKVKLANFETAQTVAKTGTQIKGSYNFDFTGKFGTTYVQMYYVHAYVIKTSWRDS